MVPKKKPQTVVKVITTIQTTNLQYLVSNASKKNDKNATTYFESKFASVYLYLLLKILTIMLVPSPSTQ